MYFKLAINNVKKSFKDYTIYFLTLTFAVCIFYAFNSIGSQRAMSAINNTKSDSIKQISNIMSIISVFVSIVLGCLIIYANNFLIKRRKKELGLYMSLGMAKSKISKLLVIEEFVIGLFSLVVGLILGLILSQGLSIITAKLFDLELKNYKFTVSTDAIIKTIIYFAIIYLLVMIFNSMVISKYKLIDLLNAHRKNESIKVKNPIIAGFIFITSLVMLGFAYYLVNKSGLNFKKLSFQLSIILGVLGTAAFFYGLTTFLIMIIEKNKNIYLKNLRIFTLRQMNNKINTNFFSMTIICLMLFITISLLSVGISFKRQNIDNNLPFDISFFMYNDTNESLQETLNNNGFKIQPGDKYAYISEYNLNETVKSVLGKYLKGKLSENFIENGESKINAISISDYNKIRELNNEKPLKLNNNSVLIQSNLPFAKENVNNFIENNNTIKIDGKDYKIADKKIITSSNITSSIQNNLFTLIVPNNVIEDKKINTYYLDINYSKDNKDTSEKYYTEFFKSIKKAENFKDKFILCESKNSIKEEMLLITTIILYIGLYIGVIFLISSAAILGLQQLSEASDSSDRYVSLRRIGATESMINKSIFTQTLLYFSLPLILAVIHSIVAIYQANDFISVFGNSNIVQASIMTMGVIIVIYGAYFVATYLSYKNIIKKF